MRLTLVLLGNILLPNRLTHYLREWMKTCRTKMGFEGTIPLEEAPPGTRVALEEIFLPVVETLEAVETREILTPPFPNRGNS